MRLFLCKVVCLIALSFDSSAAQPPRTQSSQIMEYVHSSTGVVFFFKIDSAMPLEFAKTLTPFQLNKGNSPGSQRYMAVAGPIAPSKTCQLDFDGEKIQVILYRQEPLSLYQERLALLLHAYRTATPVSIIFGCPASGSNTDPPVIISIWMGLNEGQ